MEFCTTPKRHRRDAKRKKCAVAIYKSEHQKAKGDLEQNRK